MVDTGYSIRDDQHLRTSQKVIEYRASSIEYHVFAATTIMEESISRFKGLLTAKRSLITFM